MNGRRAVLLAPLAVAGLAGAGAWSILARMKQGRFDPHDVPSQLIGRKVPDFAPLPPLRPGQPAPAGEGFGAADLARAGRPILVNFFASWCVPCIIEAPALMMLAEEKVPIWGIAYKDKPEAAQTFLVRNGNPYARLAADEPGRVAIEWGLYGVPETYLIDRTGTVRWRQAGPITDDVLATQLRPMLKQVA